MRWKNLSVSLAVWMATASWADMDGPSNERLENGGSRKQGGNMPYAIVIHALPRSDLPMTHAQGKVLHGLFYEILQEASAAKGDEVHGTDGSKPFSTALLLDERQRRAEHVHAGEELRIRFTFL